MLSGLKLGAVSLAKAVVPTAARPFVSRMYRKLVGNGDWSEIEFTMLPVLVPAGRGSIDVGANQGTYTKELSRLSAFVYAFEPDEALARRLHDARLTNVTVRNAALSRCQGDQTLRIPIVAGKPQVALASLSQVFAGPSIATKVRTETLDAYANEDIGFLKIDVEGHEEEVLEGGLRLIAQQRPVVLIEVENRHRAGSVERVTAIFNNSGYSGLFVLQNRVFDMAELRPTMMDHRQLMLSNSRKKMKYVNNFIFCPSAKSAADLRRSLQELLLQGSV